MKHFLQTWRQTERGEEGNSAAISFIRYDYLEYKFIVMQVVNVSTFLGDVIKFLAVISSAQLWYNLHSFAPRASELSPL